MLDGRSKQRKNAKALIGVYDETDGELIGYLLDLTINGVRIKSLKAITSNIGFEFRMDLPPGFLDCTAITFRAKSKWCKKCAESCYHETGFQILDCSTSEAEKIVTLLASDLFATKSEKLHITLSMKRW